jgi:hypothetical protein
MKNEYSRKVFVTTALFGVFWLTMNFGLGLVFDGHFARLLAAAATWSVAVFLLALPIRGLPYRRGFWGGSNFAGVMMAFAIASVIAAANSHGAYAVAAIILTLPVAAMNVLLDRMLFTDEERLEINKHSSGPMQRRKSCCRASPVIGEEIR